MFRKVVIGGTFNMIHKGHRRILKTGLQLAKSAIIGLTSDDFASRFRVEKVIPYEKRRENLEKFLRSIGKPYEIVEIMDSYGIATVDPEIDCIVVSEETLLRAEEINAIRFKKGLEKLTIVVVPILLAEDGKPISADRINSGEIDMEGRVLKR
ncbi:MAG TPA: phosphopantetheine adenylyltransferase [Candidatus Altiarchaeales archaeon]|nr:phosphopantetheine adenylyltransferase [Candidatus Altiarchaeales archaeon]